MKNKQAQKKDFDRLVQIISCSFAKDPCFTWLLGKKKLESKINFLAAYLVEETFAKGHISISPNGDAATFWQSDKKERLSAAAILRDIKFLYYLGLPAVLRSLKLLRIKNLHIADQNPYLYLACIGVMPEGQGKGLASALLDPVLAEAQQAGKNVYLETANPINVSIYKRKGFEIVDEVDLTTIKLTFMVKRCTSI